MKAQNGLLTNLTTQAGATLGMTAWFLQTGLESGVKVGANALGRKWFDWTGSQFMGKGDGFTFRNFGLRCQFKQVDVLEPGSRSSHPWDWKVGSSPAPGVTVLYTGVNDPPVSGTSE